MKTLSQLRWAVRGEVRERGATFQTQTGTVSAAADSVTVTGTGTLFLTEYAPGQELRVGGVVRTIIAVASDTSLTLHKALGAVASGAAHELVMRQGGWTDQDVDERINDELRHIESQLLRYAPGALAVPVLANLVAGEDLVSVPTGLRRVDLIEYQPAGSPDRWTALTELAPRGRFGAGVNAFYNGAGTKSTGAPRGFTFRGAAQVELDVYAESTRTGALCFWGCSGLADLDADADTLALAADTDLDVPDAVSLEAALVYGAAARLLAMSETTLPRAAACKQMATEELRAWAQAHHGRGGRSNGVKRVRITGGC